jgi:hypothetical protein
MDSNRGEYDRSFVDFMSRLGGAYVENSLPPTRNRSIIAAAMNSRLLVIASSLSLAFFAWLGSLSAGVPTIYCPLPNLTFLPILLLARARLFVFGIFSFAILIPPVLFMVWSPDMLRLRLTILPKRTVALTAILSLLTVFYFIVSWKHGLEYQGQKHTIIVCLMNILWLGMLWWAILRALRQPSFKTSLLSHWLLFAWLSWYAFPYLGELP